MKNSFLIYYEYRDILEDLTNEELGMLFRAIFDYEIDGTIPNFESLLMKMAFKVIKGNLDRDSNKYDKRCETSAQNGAKGGRPKKDEEKPKKPNLKPKKPKKADNDNETDTDNDTDNDNENDTDAETDSDVNADFAEPKASETNADLFTSEDDTETSADLFSFIEEAFGRTLNSIEYEIILTWEDNDLTRYAVKESILNGARGIRYIETVLESWKSKGFKTVQDVQAYQRKYKNQKNRKEEAVPDWLDNEIIDARELTEEERIEMGELINAISK